MESTNFLKKIFSLPWKHRHILDCAFVSQLSESSSHQPRDMEMTKQLPEFSKERNTEDVTKMTDNGMSENDLP